MPSPVRRRITAGSLAAIAIAYLLSEGAQAQQVGTAAAVNPSAQARGARGSRTVFIGQSIAHRERIQTTSAGSLQLLFLDKTTMTIGPNSDLAIDEYVYDPNTSSGRLAATLSRGVMRFVGGQISHAGNAQVTTPTAVVGVRGGVAIFSPQSVYVAYGQSVVQSGPAPPVTLTAGEWTQTRGRGTPPTNPGPPPEGFLASVMAQLQSQRGQGGGAPKTARAVDQARLAATGTPNGSIGTVTAPDGSVNLAPATNTLSGINQAIQTTNIQSLTQQTATRTRTNPTEPQTGETLPTPNAAQRIEVSPQPRR